MWTFNNNGPSFIITKEVHNEWVLKCYWYSRRKKQKYIRILYLYSKCNDCMIYIIKICADKAYFFYFKRKHSFINIIAYSNDIIAM